MSVCWRSAAREGTRRDLGKLWSLCQQPRKLRPEIEEPGDRGSRWPGCPLPTPEASPSLCTVLPPGTGHSINYSLAGWTNFTFLGFMIHFPLGTCERDGKGLCWLGAGCQQQWHAVPVWGAPGLSWFGVNGPQWIPGLESISF